MAPAAVERVKRVVIMVQENHTTDNYFPGLAPYGGAVATGRSVRILRRRISRMTAAPTSPGEREQGPRPACSSTPPPSFRTTCTWP
jgi:hypothetical protein